MGVPGSLLLLAGSLLLLLPLLGRSGPAPELRSSGPAPELRSRPLLPEQLSRGESLFFGWRNLSCPVCKALFTVLDIALLVGFIYLSVYFSYQGWRVQL